MSKSTFCKSIKSLQGRLTLAEPDYTVEAQEEQISLLNHSEHQAFKELRTLRKLYKDARLRIKYLEDEVTANKVVIDGLTPSTVSLMNEVVEHSHNAYPDLVQDAMDYGINLGGVAILVFFISYVTNLF